MVDTSRMNSEAYQVLKKKFGRVMVENSNEYRVCCPKCESRAHKKDVKFKLYINPYKVSKNGKRGTWNCFRCSYKGWGLDTLGVQTTSESALPSREEAPAGSRTLNIFHETKKLKTTSEEKSGEGREEQEVKLPTKFSTEWSSSLTGRACYEYLVKQRGLSVSTITDYNIGFCSKGRYAGHIVFPITDQNNKLIYFVTRSIYEKTYFNCPGPNSHVFFNYKNQEHIVLTEGIFDALAVGTDGVALLGKILKKQQFKILKNSPPKYLTVFLDADAFKDANTIAEKLESYVQHIRIAAPPRDKDPGNLSKAELNDILEDAWYLK